MHLVYRTAKLFQRTLALLPSLEDRVDNLDRIAVEKGVMFLSPNDVKLQDVRRTDRDPAAACQRGRRIAAPFARIAR